MGSAHAVGVCGAKLPARTGIGSHDELKARGEVRDGVGSVDADHPRLERLAQRLERGRFELRSLIA